MPKDTREIPKSYKQNRDEIPMFCLLEDDNLISRVNVTTDRLLVLTAHKSEVRLVIRVTTKKITGTMGNAALG